MNHTTLLYDTIPAPPSTQELNRFDSGDVAAWMARQGRYGGWDADELSLEKRISVKEVAIIAPPERT